ncbi:MAG: YtxH domain-containing protein [Myxococcota bacterium]
MADHHTGSFLLAFLGGAALGAGIAYLTAPRAGLETREALADQFRTRRDELRAIPPALQSAYNAAAEAARDTFQRTYESQIEAHPQAQPQATPRPKHH